MRYHAPGFTSEAATRHAVVTGSTGEVCEAIIGASLHTEEPAWVEVLCLDLATTSDVEAVQASAVLGLAHLARRFGHLDHRQRADALLDQLGAAPGLAGRVEDVRSDFQIFLDR